MLRPEAPEDIAWLRVEAAPALVRGLVVEKLRTAITRGRLSPGDRLVERTLCEQLHVSRPSLREALRQLESEGLVEIVPFKGPSVRIIGMQEAGELYDLRAGVEGLCARYFAERGSEAEIESYARALAELDRALRRGERQRIFSAKSAYYEAFTDGCHSASVKALAMQLIARLSYLWSTSLRFRGRVDQGIAEMQAILAAVRRSEPEAAFEAARTYVLHARSIGLAAMQASAAAGQRSATTTRRRHA
ncbi:MAG: GntR family transcriptional regulator [Lautropia sp.]